jgi:CTD kinase subunit beta
MASYAIRFPDRVAKVKSHGGDVEIVDPAVSAYFTFVPGILNTEWLIKKEQDDRRKLLGIERLILETICFNFTSRLPFPYIIKIGRTFRGSYLLDASMCSAYI